jgi:hypothetical protein
MGFVGGWGKVDLDVWWARSPSEACRTIEHGMYRQRSALRDRPRTRTAIAGWRVHENHHVPYFILLLVLPK